MLLQSPYSGSRSPSKIIRAPEILIPRTIELYAEAPVVRITGHFGGFEVLCARTGMVKRRYPGVFANLITNEGIGSLGLFNVTTMLTYAVAGTGNTVPAASNTTLAAELHRSSSAGGFPAEAGYDTTTTPANPFWYYRRPRLFSVPPGGAAIYAEIGMADTNSAATDRLWSRALIKDSGGATTTIAVAADEQLKLYYEWRIYPPQVDLVQTYSATIRGVATNIDVTWRPAAVTDSNFWGSTDGLLMGAGTGNSSYDPYSYVSNNTVMPARTTYNSTGIVQANTANTETGGGAGNGWVEHYNEWSASVANFNIGYFLGGRQSTYAGGPGQYLPWQATFVPTINKTSSDKFIFRQRYSYTQGAIP